MLQPAGRHDADAIAERQCLLLVVSDEQGRRADGDLDPPDLLAQLPAHLRVECGQWLVEKEHLRLDRERPGKGDPLLLAARHLVGIPVGLLLEPDELEHCSGSLTTLVPADSPEPQPVGDVVDARHVGEQAVGLEHDAHAAFARRDMGDVLAVHQDPATVDLVQSAERAQRCRLATPGWTEQRHQLAWRDVDRQAVEGVDRAVPAMHVLELNADATAGGRRSGGGGSHVAGASSGVRWAPAPAPGAKRAMM